jgi:CBS domain-containing membrane protein
VQPLDPARVAEISRNSNWTESLSTWLKGFRPAPLNVDLRERGRAVAGALVGILITAVLCRLYASSGNAVWLIAPLGASAVLVFALPASPLAQPWSVVGGNTLSALMGVLCLKFIGDPAIAGGVAVAAAIAAMFALRCLHPPGGAVALLAVLTHASSFGFVLFPVLVNSVLLAVAGILYNTATGRRYPHSQIVERAGSPTPASRFSSADLDEVLKRYNQVLDVGRDELENILHMAEMNAMERRLSDLRCRDIMTRNVVTVEYGTDLQDAWALMRRHRVKALPVVDRQRRIIGIVSLADFMRNADLDLNHTLRERLHQLIRRSETVHTSKPEAVGQIMSAKVRVASADRSVAELMPIFSEDGHHHIPIIDDENRLVGIITESDFVRAMYRSGGVRGQP